mgnify:CR=1 FL=1
MKSIGNGRVCTRFATRLSVRRTFFEHIYLSYELKMAKPDADIFQKVLDETGILPNETLFIDDSEANCRTAEALGISTYTPKAHEDWRHAVVL